MNNQDHSLYWTDSTIDHTTFDQRGQQLYGPQYNVAGNLTMQPPPPRIPLQRPPRTEHFMDRQQALTNLLAALHPGAVVTLCGPGGIGKTALAAEALWQLPADRFPAGIITHSFYGRGQIDLACEHIARTLGEELKPNPRSAAQRALAGRQLLLFLDGAEEADDLPTLLALRGGCGVLVTSRRRNDALATRQDVDPLPLADALALLQAWGGPRASDTTAAGTIADLVGHLPLALRLAGRYLAHYEENATDYLTWLQETPLAALDQSDRCEQSVPLLLDRSLAQLSETARQVLGVVGVLALAPFDTAALATALDLSDRTAHHALGELLNYSLLRRPDDTYTVSHALIHTYARERLTPPPAVIERLTAHYTGLIKANATAFGILNPLRPHVVALMGACTIRQIWMPVPDLAGAIHDYLDFQGYSADRLSVINAALSAAQAQQDRQQEGTWQGNLGLAYGDLGMVKQSITHYQQALAISREMGSRRSEAIWLGNLGNVYSDLEQVEEAIAHYQQALAISREIGDRHNEGCWLGGLGNVYSDLEQAEEAIAHYQQALAISREIGDRRGEGEWLENLGRAYAEHGNGQEALKLCHQSLAIRQEISDRPGQGAVLHDLGYAYFVIGDLPQAQVLLEQAITILHSVGYQRPLTLALLDLGETCFALNQLPQAQIHWQEALMFARSIGDRRSEGETLVRLGCIDQATG